LESEIYKKSLMNKKALRKEDIEYVTLFKKCAMCKNTLLEKNMLLKRER